VSALAGDAVIFPAIAGQTGLLVGLDARTRRAEQSIFATIASA
jgi:hypothetical protein